MAHRSAPAAALLAVLAACGDDAPGAPADAAIDAPVDARRDVVCARPGTSSVTGTGPAGSLGTSHVYATALDGFCPDSLILIVTTDDPLAYPYLEGSGRILVPLPQGTISGTTEWSGTFPATISLPDETADAAGTLEVDLGTPGHQASTRLRATARFDDGAWHFTATIDAPYCQVTTCI